MERKEFLEKVLAYGRQAGFTDCEVYYRGGKAFEVLILEGEVSDYENSREEGLAFRGNINGRTGYAYTEQLTRGCHCISGGNGEGKCGTPFPGGLRGALCRRGKLP